MDMHDPSKQEGLPLSLPLADLVRQWDGPLTRDLVLEPGKFGLGKIPSKLSPEATTTMVCGYCSTGCGLNIHLKDGEAINLSPATHYPVNMGMACPKGWEALSVLDSDDRAKQPLVRHECGVLIPASWPQAIKRFVEGFRSIIQRHGRESVAFLSTGQMPTEEMLLLGCLAKFGMGWIHGDSNTRQCMATAAVAYKQALGFDAPPYSYADFEESDCLVFVGANPCVAHPIMWERVLRNKRNPHLIVVDPRRTETAMAATCHLAIQPKTDLTLFYGVAQQLIAKGWVDEAYVANHTSGFEAFAKHVSSFTLSRVAEETGLSVQAIEACTATIHDSPRVSFWWTMGVNQSYQGVRTAQSLINLALMTGNFGRPGTGANSITGQCNAMGSRLLSNTSALVGGRDFTSASDREEVAKLLEIPVSKIPEQNSLCYDQILDQIHAGKIKGLWIIATNTAHSWVQQGSVQEALKKLDFLVVQDMYRTTETAHLAHVVLPAAGWGEKEGTFINSERRLGVLKKVKRAPGQALADFSIFRLIAEAWGCDEMFAKWDSPEAVFQIMKRLSQGRPFDITGVDDYRKIDAAGGIQWPYPATNPPSGNQRRLFEDGKFYHADGKAKFLFTDPVAMPEPPCSEYPFLLITGRGTVSQWHTQTRTGKSSVLRKLYPQECYVELHPADARKWGVEAQDLVTVQSRRGSLKARAVISAAVGEGKLFVPMHYAATNQLTLPHFDPYSRQPSYKDCAVKIFVSGKERKLP